MKRERKIKLISLIMAVVMLFSVSTFCYGDEIKDKQNQYSDIQDEIEKAQQQLDKGKTKLSNVTKEMTSLETKIVTTQRQIDSLTANINGVKSQINEKLDELAELEKNISMQNDDLNARLRSMYKNGNAGMLSVLFSSTSMSNLLTNIEMARRIYASDSMLLLKLHDEYDDIYEKKLELTSLKSSLLAQQTELDNKKAGMKSDEEELAKQKSAIAKDNKELQAQLDIMNAEADALIAEIKRLQSGGDYVGGFMCWPSRASKRITEYFGRRAEHIPGASDNHTGIDIGAAGGTDILAAAAGTVIAAGYKPYSYGNYIMIDHGGQVVTLYGHAKKLLVKTGDVVKRGQVIGLVGTTGLSTGNHIHFEIRINGQYVNPLDNTQLYYVEPGVFYFD